MVTGLAALLGWTAGLRGRRLLSLVGSVLSGQLSIGWSNDLIDARRDRTVRRVDKPLVTDARLTLPVAVACGTATLSTAALSVRAGRRAGVVHGVLVVGSGWAYNVGLKRTVFSFVPYAVAFGALPQVATLYANPSRFAPATRSVAGALLGVAAHLLNVLPDLEDDRRTGVRGLPHRLSARQLRVAAATSLGVSSVAALAEGGLTPSEVAGWGASAAALGAGVAVGRGSVPFYSAAGFALLDAGALLRAARSTAT